MAKFGTTSTPVDGSSPSQERTSASRSSVMPLVPTTTWMPLSTQNRTLSITESGWVRSTATCAPLSTSAERSSPRLISATSSVSGASPIARTASEPIRPRAPSTATLIGELMTTLRATSAWLPGRAGSHTRRQILKVSIRTHHRGGERAPQHLTREVSHILDGDLVDALQRLLHAEVPPVVQLRLADAAHPRRAVLQPQHQAAAQLAAAPLHLFLGEPVLRDLGEDPAHHLGDLAQPIRSAPRVHRERAGPRVRRGGRVHRVGQPALLPDLLEQPRAHPASQ